MDIGVYRGLHFSVDMSVYIYGGWEGAYFEEVLLYASWRWRQTGMALGIRDCGALRSV